MSNFWFTLKSKVLLRTKVKLYNSKKKILNACSQNEHINFNKMKKIPASIGILIKE